jgi:hypothetical protein
VFSDLPYRFISPGRDRPQDPVSVLILKSGRLLLKQYSLIISSHQNQLRFLFYFLEVFNVFLFLFIYLFFFIHLFMCAYIVEAMSPPCSLSSPSPPSTEDFKNANSHKFEFSESGREGS